MSEAHWMDIVSWAWAFRTKKRAADSALSPASLGPPTPALMVAEGATWARTAAAAAAFALAALSAAAVFSGKNLKKKAAKASVCWRRKCRLLALRVGELEAQLEASLEKGAAERRGRVRAQQALRKTLTQQSTAGSKSEPGSPMWSFSSSYPMAPIATVRSCFSTRNGTPRQPLLVPLARASLVLDPSRVPPTALEGLAEYSHCWVLYVFHLNTDLEKLWRDPSRSKFKAKVRVPRLKGGKMGVLATRSPHRPCPVGLSVAKVEAVDGHAILLSGVDLVDGTPVLDIKPYLPYSDCIQGATVPAWIAENSSLAVASVEFSEDFSASLASCWETAGKWSLYASHDNLQRLIKQVLSWDIRSLSQKNQPHTTTLGENVGGSDLPSDMVDESDERFSKCGKTSSPSPGEVIYHLIVEGIDVTYRIDGNSNIMVENASLSDVVNCARNQQSCITWRDKFD